MAMDAGATLREGTSAQHPRSESAAHPLPLWYTLTLTALVVAATLYGLLASDAYRVPEYLKAIWRAQDAATMLTLPVLVWSAIRGRSGSLRGHLVWLGMVLWLAYGYAHYAFGAPYNHAFLAYVAILGMAGYGLADGLLRVDVAAAARAFSGAPRHAASWFLFIGGLGIAALWLGEIIVALPDGQPAGNLVYDMPSPTYVIDFALVIPLAIAAAWLTRRGHAAGPVLAAVMLVMLFVLSLAMLAVIPSALTAGLQADPPYAKQLVVFGVLFAILAVVEGALLIMGGRRMRPVTASWLRRGLWPAAIP